MSLTSQLKDTASPLRRFFEEQLPHTTAIERATQQQLAKRTPIVPDIGATPYPWPLIGTAIDYRLRYYFTVTPVRELVAWQGAHMFVGGLPEAEGDDYVVDPRTGFLDLNDPANYSGQRDVAMTFFRSLETFLAQVNPVRVRLAEQDEAQLARFCCVLAHYENIYRSGHVAPELTSARSADDLLQRIPANVVADLSRLSWAFFDARHDLLTQSFTLNPTFAGSRDVGGADADFIIERCLIDIKTTKASKLDKQWLYQLLGYVLLDYSDVYQIAHVGIYYARQTFEVRWPVGDLIRELSGDPALTVDLLRKRFQQVIKGRGQSGKR